MNLEQEVGEGAEKKNSESRAMLQRKEELGCSIASGRTKDLGKL